MFLLEFKKFLIKYILQESLGQILKFKNILIEFLKLFRKL